ncbi:hypothetical protein LSTR_LSTR005020 [Laodelphax striatellus]|uniref:Uncharacterized protein n=1 Tax=Laodelphax striatellus TaxID=195883 RepID=A0A482WGY6_LAOST|nr:hypothetical protein LSTR_LSTR017606 [Laodelphax striatellus]RZF36707.1 hypothetical protein LSTR_LSTR005020 [Laodelphax striatellus]
MASAANGHLKGPLKFWNRSVLWLSGRPVLSNAITTAASMGNAHLHEDLDDKLNHESLDGHVSKSLSNANLCTTSSKVFGLCSRSRRCTLRDNIIPDERTKIQLAPYCCLMA